MQNEQVQSQVDALQEKTYAQILEVRIVVHVVGQISWQHRNQCHDVRWPEAKIPCSEENEPFQYL